MLRVVSERLVTDLTSLFNYKLYFMHDELKRNKLPFVLDRNENITAELISYLLAFYLCFLFQNVLFWSNLVFNIENRIA